MRRRFVSTILAVLLVIVFAAGALAAESVEETQGLTLEEAIQLALSKSNALEKADWEMKQTEEDKDDAFDLLYPQYTGDEPVIAYLRAKMSDEITDLSYLQQKDMIIYDTRDQYYGILLAQKELLAARSDLALQEIKSANAQLGYQVGVQSLLSSIEAQSNLISTRETLRQKEDGLLNAYKSFNQQVGFSEEARPVLVDMPEYSPIPEDSTLESYILEALEGNPTVASAEAAVSMQEKIEGMDSYQDGDLEKAKLELKMARDGVTEGVRNLYYQVRSLEAQHNSLNESIKVLEEGFRIKKLMFDVGMATNTEVLEAENALIEAQTSLFQVEVNHSLAKELLVKPWAA